MYQFKINFPKFQNVFLHSIANKKIHISVCLFFCENLFIKFVWYIQVLVKKGTTGGFMDAKEEDTF